MEVKIFKFNKGTYRAILKNDTCEIRKLQELPGGGAMMSDPEYSTTSNTLSLDDHIQLFKTKNN